MLAAAPALPPRPLCPPGACNCAIETLLMQPPGQWRILQLTRAEEQRLVQRLENLRDLGDLRHMQQRMAQQLGISLGVAVAATTLHLSMVARGASELATPDVMAGFVVIGLLCMASAWSFRRLRGDDGALLRA